ncbi:HAD family hydrolase [Maridesulfovibrio bastinii]|uniref:HAD family hydrolase n=1 Tax=Maridesulfovibrio bastinii TaxID=47157 RepID=UPI0004036165|nr:HAD hydrolase-like protein [Maridesulfovibrio bastinii]
MESKAKKRFYFDLDGTLINSHKRLHALFNELVPEGSISFDEYWKNRRDNISDAEMLKKFHNADESRLAEYAEQWLKHKEDDHLMEMDTPYPDAVEVLKHCSEAGDVYIVTARNNIPKAERQIKEAGFTPFVTRMLVTENKTTKQKLVTDILTPHKDDVFVGDTAEDMNTGKALGVYTIGMTHGFLSKEQLLKLNPDDTADNIQELIDKLNV